MAVDHLLPRQEVGEDLAEGLVEAIFKPQDCEKNHRVVWSLNSCLDRSFRLFFSDLDIYLYLQRVGVKGSVLI